MHTYEQSDGPGPSGVRGAVERENRMGDNGGEPPVGGAGEVVFFNGAEEPCGFSWRQRGAAHWRDLSIEAGKTARFALEEEG